MENIKRKPVPMKERFTADTLASEVISAFNEPLPVDVEILGKQLVLDTVGCMLGAATIEPGKAAAQVAVSIGAGSSTILGASNSASQLGAAYANAQLGNILDFDDTWKGLGHPGAAITAAALVVGEELGSSGMEVLKAIVLGYEVATRVAEAIRPSPERIEQVWGQGTLIVFGVATAVALLQKQSPEQLAHTYGLVGIHAPVPAVRKIGYSARPLGWTKNNFGWAAMAGTLSAQLVKEHGYWANRSIFDGDTGFWRMSGSDRVDLGPLTSKFDSSSFRLRSVSFKPYPCCRYIHPTMDACTDLLASVDELNVDNIERVDVIGAKKLSDYADYSPYGVIDLQFSIPYLVAIALHRIPVGLAWLDEQHIANASIKGLAERVTIVHEPAADQHYRNLTLVTTVEIALKGGKRFKASVEVPRGDPSRPLTQQELEAKFMHLAAAAVGEHSAEVLTSGLMRLDQATNVRDLLVHCKPASG